LRELKAHDASVLDVKANDIRIVSCGSDGLIKIWEMTTPINKLPKDALI
jgi:WD40 repeat protein